VQRLQAGDACHRAGGDSGFGFATIGAASTRINITKRGKIQLTSALVFAETVTSITMHVLVR
jgi:hypothetical protein